LTQIDGQESEKSAKIGVIRGYKALFHFQSLVLAAAMTVAFEIIYGPSAEVLQEF
jgi:hypothetical protein